MEIAVMADIHGNYVALERCMEFCRRRGIDTYFFLGDYAGELAYPERAMDMLFEIKEKNQCYFVRGNKEDYWKDYHARGETGWKEYDSTTGSLYYTYYQLSQKSMDFYDMLPIRQKVKIGNFPEMTICHGSPYKTNEKLLPDKERTVEIMKQNDTNVILCGHTHIQGSIENEGRCVLNAGALGVSLFAEGKAQFMILSDDIASEDVSLRWNRKEELGIKYAFLSLSYDVERVIQDLHVAGLNQYAPCWCKVTEYLLRKGDVAHGFVLNRAMELCEKAEGECIWPYIPEKYWEQAVREMIKC
ncbi:MAG: metallophosphoesterase family protein [Lachnospiraceae bacterium]|nr:metallophosphoesterase family protein [Lachnospiraceae bacterium]